uniref:Two-component system, OmpR family, response regulator n=1 Tax=Candidatus Kentrum sp. FW TaxID=2126338 RepID=A0A450TPL6_9GAMM|nr:MAG: two-component system, OmpR family, response regulator [Candidatus Kentron sp. FW]
MNTNNMKAKGKVLVVDDEPDITRQFQRALEDEGYFVETATSGEEAWEKYQQQYFDVVWPIGKWKE